MKVKRSGCLFSTVFGFALVLLAAANDTSDYCETTTEKPGPQKYIRLPTSVLPIHYDIKIHFYMVSSDPTDFMIKGHVKIHVRCVNATNNITLHAHDLKVETQTIQVSGESGIVTVPKYIGTEEDKDRQFLIIKLDRDLEAGRNYIIEISYSAPLVDNNENGLILRSYLRNNKPEYLAVTNFRPTGARKAFPCFDEPSFKTTFNFTIIRPEKLKSMSNVYQRDKDKIKRIIEANETYVIDDYFKTPIMSTYTIVFLVSDFNATRNTQGGLMFRVWDSPDTLSRMNKVLDLSVKIHDFFQNFFNVTYPPKSDIVAVPDLPSHAMGSFGLLTISEKLFQEGENKEVTEENLALNLTYAVCQQWLGGLVSPAWWDDNWVNEGLTTLMAYLAVDDIYPEWNIFEKFLLDRQFAALSIDNGKKAFPLYRKVNYHKEIKDAFKKEIYNKAASIFRMLQHFLGHETFKKGLRRYLHEFQYKSANHDQLWNSFQQQAREDRNDTLEVKAVMDTWTLLEGSPLVTITTSGSGQIIKAQQSINVPAVNSYLSRRPASEYTWQIPITFVSGATKDLQKTDKDVYWLTTRNITTFNLTQEIHRDNWICANVEMIGYYKVKYAFLDVSAIAGQLRKNHEVIPVMTRAQLIYDTWNLAKEGVSTMDHPLRIIKYIDKEREYLPLATSSNELLFANVLFEFSDLAEYFKIFMQKKLLAPYKYFTNPHEQKRHDVLSRQLIVREACHYGVSECHRKVHGDYQEMMRNNNKSSIEKELLQTVVCYGIAAGGDEEWNYALEMYKNESSMERLKLLYTLACSEKNETLSKYLSLILDNNSTLKEDDGLWVIKFVALKTKGRLLAWNYFKNNFLAIKTKFGGSFYWTTIFNDVVKTLHTDSELEEVKTFFNSSSLFVGTDIQLVQKALQKVNENHKWVIDTRRNTKKWLKDNIN